MFEEMTKKYASDLELIYNKGVIDGRTNDQYTARLEKENTKLKSLLEEKHKVGNSEFWKTVWHSIWRNEELEKENIELKARLSNLQSEFTGLENFLYSKIEELKTQIRKMKRCQNCDKFDYTECKCKVGWCNNFEKWALKEVVFVDLKELDDDSE